MSRPGRTRRRLECAALVVAVAATVPSLVLKLLWLSRSNVGMTDGEQADEMHSTRFLVGNSATVGPMLVEAGLVVALTRPWAERLPAGLMLVLGGGAPGFQLQRAGFPDHLIDAKRAVAWARRHGNEFGAVPATLFVAGSCVGGHLAAMAALTANDPAYQLGLRSTRQSAEEVRR